MALNLFSNDSDNEAMFSEDQDNYVEDNDSEDIDNEENSDESEDEEEEDNNDEDLEEDDDNSEEVAEGERPNIDDEDEPFNYEQQIADDILDKDQAIHQRQEQDQGQVSDRNISQNVYTDINTEYQKFYEELNEFNYETKLYKDYAQDWDVETRLNYKDTLDQKRSELEQKDSELKNKQYNLNQQHNAYIEQQQKAVKTYAHKRHSTIIHSDDVVEKNQREALLFMWADQESLKAHQSGRPISNERAIDLAAITLYKLGLKPNKTNKNVKHNRRNIAVTNTSNQSINKPSNKNPLGQMKAKIIKDGYSDYAKQQYGSVEKYAKYKLERKNRR